MTNYNKYLVQVEFPHEYWPDRNISFSNKEDAEFFAKERAEGTLGVKGYVRTTVYKKVKEFA